MNGRDFSLLPFLHNHSEISPSDFSATDLEIREQILANLERDVKFATDELSRRRFHNPPKFCVDFDIMYEASQLSGPEDRLPFWSSLLFYLDAARQVILPGSLIEVMNFFQTHYDEEVGSVGRQFIDAFRNSSDLNPALLKAFGGAGQSFRKSRLYQKRYIFSLLQKKCEIVSSDEIGKFSESYFDAAVRILANSNRSEKVLNNRVDAMNFAIISSMYDGRSEASPEWVLISNSLSMRNLQRTVIDPRNPARKRSQHVVWNSRSASIFQCLCAVSTDMLDASEMAWDLYQEVVDERRATQFAIDRHKTGGSFSPPAKRNYQTDIASLIFGVELHGLAGAANFGGFIEGLERETSVEIDAAHEALNAEVEQFLEESVAKKKLSSYNSLVRIKKDTAKIERREIPQFFSCKAHFAVSSDATDTIDHILIYDDKVQVVVEGDISPIQYISALDQVRSSIRSRLIRNTLLVDDPDSDTCDFVLLYKGQLIQAMSVELAWSILAPHVENTGENVDVGERISPSISRDIDRIRGVLFNSDAAAPAFFRMRTKYFDTSFEGKAMVLSSVGEDLRDEFEIFHKTLSEHKLDSFGEVVYDQVRRVGEQVV